eukprot:gene6752-13687_t
MNKGIKRPASWWRATTANPADLLRDVHRGETPTDVMDHAKIHLLRGARLWDGITKGSVSGKIKFECHRIYVSHLYECWVGRCKYFPASGLKLRCTALLWNVIVSGLDTVDIFTSCSVVACCVDELFGLLGEGWLMGNGMEVLCDGDGSESSSEG